MQRHPYEWPILAENHWPNHGRKLTLRSGRNDGPGAEGSVRLGKGVA
jgi:hypothetical protein